MNSCSNKANEEMTRRYCYIHARYDRVPTVTLNARSTFDGREYIRRNARQVRNATNRPSIAQLYRSIWNAIYGSQQYGDCTIVQNYGEYNEKGGVSTEIAKTDTSLKHLLRKSAGTILTTATTNVSTNLIVSNTSLLEHSVVPFDCAIAYVVDGDSGAPSAQHPNKTNEERSIAQNEEQLVEQRFMEDAAMEYHFDVRTTFRTTTAQSYVKLMDLPYQNATSMWNFVNNTIEWCEETYATLGSYPVRRSVWDTLFIVRENNTVGQSDDVFGNGFVATPLRILVDVGDVRAYAKTLRTFMLILYLSCTYNNQINRRVTSNERVSFSRHSCYFPSKTQGVYRELFHASIYPHKLLCDSAIAHDLNTVRGARAWLEEFAILCLGRNDGGRQRKIDRIHCTESTKEMSAYDIPD